MRTFFRFACLLAVATANLHLPATVRNVWVAAGSTPEPEASDAAASAADVAATGATQIFLPVLPNVSPLPELPPMQAIWADGGAYATQAVALFRKTLAASRDVKHPVLHVFADTRYELYVDGVLAGRGPARFSEMMQEYDSYDLSWLPRGRHVIAAVVQWAPNRRRSESIRPAFYLRLVDDAGQILVSTDATWKAVISPAWRSDSGPVQAWGLVGPTEQLDFHRLPLNWKEDGYDDTGWGAAAVVERYTGKGGLRPRSIPSLANYPMPARVIDSGLLSPGAQFGELQPESALPYRIPLDAPEPGSLVIEVVSPSGPPASGFARYRTQGLAWTPAGVERPNVYAATLAVPAGRSDLTIESIPADGLTFNLQSVGVPLPDLGFDLGVRTGRRLLLSSPVPDTGAVQIAGGDSGLTLSFQRQPAYVVLDLGRVIHGRLVATVEGPAGSSVDIGWDERQYMGRRPLPYPGSLHGDLWDQTDAWILDGQPRELTTLDTRAGRYILIAAWGNGPVRLSGVRVYETRYPAVLTGGFESSDPLLDRIWQIGVDTLYPNMTDAYTDTPWRERGQWWGDASVDFAINRAAFGDMQLLARGLRLMAEPIARTGRASAVAPNGNDTHMLDYGMLWVVNLRDYVQATNDLALLLDIFPQVVQFMNGLAKHQTDLGLLYIPCGPWTETNYIDTFAGADRCGFSTAVNSLYYEALLSTADLAERLGWMVEAQHDWGQAAVVQAAINTYLYDFTLRRYNAAFFPNGEVAGPSVYAQAWALAYGIVPPADEDGVAASLLELLENSFTTLEVGTYAMNWILAGLGRSGHVPEALDLIRAYYGWMVEQGATTWWEHFQANQAYSYSFSHAWSGSPTWFLTRYGLGAWTENGVDWVIEPSAPGFATVSGALPLRKGVLKVAWEAVEPGRAALQFSAPAGTVGQLRLPGCRPSGAIWLDGAALSESDIVRLTIAAGENDTLQVALPAGEHSLVIAGQCDL